MSTGDDSQLTDYIPNNEEEEEEIEKKIRKEVKRPDDGGVLLSYLDPDLSLEASEVAKMRRDDMTKLLEDKKLILVLNLDHTLIDSVLLKDLTDGEKHLLDLGEAMPDYFLHKLDKQHMLVKLRPYIHKFLKEANDMFEMYLFTTRDRNFLVEVVPLLDPGRMYFTSALFRKPDDTSRISLELDAGFRVENAMIIIDDNKIIWEHYKNHILSAAYNFFAYTAKETGHNVKSWSQRGKDETTSGGVLESILHVLRRVHECFYDPELKVDLTSRDVRVILDLLKKEVLGGCNILFSESGQQHFWKLDEGMGAVCTTDKDDSVTHVVAADSNTESAIWARENNKFLVTAHWILAAHCLWKQQEEEKFQLNKKID